jgi:predicted nuclease of predicted toxin-antitoxin system
VKFLVDAQLPRRLGRWLQAQGHDVIHTEELARKNRTPDPLILAQANSETRILITKDADFQLSFELGKGPPSLLLITTGNIHNDELLALFERHGTAVMKLLEEHCFIELSRKAVIVHQ